MQITTFASAKDGCSLAHSFYSGTTDSYTMYLLYYSYYKDHYGEHGDINTNVYECICTELIKNIQWVFLISKI